MNLDKWVKIGERIERARSLRGRMTQSDLARESGNTSQYISRLEGAQATRVSVDVLANIADALDVDLGYLLLLQEEERKSDSIGAEDEFLSLFRFASKRRREEITEILRIFVALDDSDMLDAMLEHEESIHKLFGDGAVGSRLVFAANSSRN